MTSEEIKKLHNPDRPIEVTVGIEICYQLALLNEMANTFWGPISYDIHALVMNECDKRKIGSRYRTTQMSESVSQE